MSKLTSAQIAQRQSVILSELNQKDNGVRKGTLLLLAICEQTQESASFADRQEQLDRNVKTEICAIKDSYPEYKPFVD